MTADNLAALPENDPALVQALCSQMQLDPDMHFEVRGVSGEEFRHAFPTPCSVREAFARYLDLSVSRCLAVS